MKKLLYILLFFIGSLSLQGQVEGYVFDSTDAATLAGPHGDYSILQPIRLPDGTYFLPKRVIYSQDLQGIVSQIHALKQDSTTIYPSLPANGEQVIAGSIYQYTDYDEIYATANEGEVTLIKCVQTHIRNDVYTPRQTPALFTFFRPNSDTLSWIENERVELGWKRVWDDITYEVIQAHMTVTGQTPDVTPALWNEVQVGCPDWVQPTGAQDAYNIGDCVTFEGNQYESLIDANVWSPSVYTQGWQLIE
jgi:hypothetical protein